MSTYKGLKLDDTKDFQKTVVDLGREMFDSNTSGYHVLSHWQGLNYIIEQWMKDNNLSIEK